MSRVELEVAAEVRVAVGDGMALAARSYNLTGPSAPVICVHGLASNARTWDQVARHLAALGHPVAAVDQRGHGASARSAAGGPYDWQTLSDDLLAVCAAFGWGANNRVPVVAGQSWGASAVLELASRYPEKLRGAVLVDGAVTDLADGFADWPSCEAALMPPVLAGMPLVDLRERLRRDHPDWSEAGIEDTLANLEVLPDGTVTPWLPREDHRVILRHMWEHRPSRVYPHLKVPVLLLPAEGRAQAHFGPGISSAEAWSASKKKGVARAGAAIPGCTVHWLVGDHDLHVQQPGVVANLIHRFTEGVLR
jgi:pimeloyl-ACP methyl ester carboxylesterase